MHVSDDVASCHSQISDVENLLGVVGGAVDRAVPVGKHRPILKGFLSYHSYLVPHQFPDLKGMT